MKFLQRWIYLIETLKKNIAFIYSLKQNYLKQLKKEKLKQNCMKLKTKPYLEENTSNWKQNQKKKNSNLKHNYTLQNLKENSESDP